MLKRLNILIMAKVLPGLILMMASAVIILQLKQFEIEENDRQHLKP